MVQRSFALPTEWILFAFVILSTSVSAPAPEEYINKRPDVTGPYRTEKEPTPCEDFGGCTFQRLRRMFKVVDDDGNRELDWEEFMTRFNHQYVTYSSDAESRDQFNRIDKDGSGSLDFGEFIKFFRPPFSKVRRDLVNRLFDTMDTTGDGVLTVEDLKGVYDTKEHRKYIAGIWTEDQVLQKFLDIFDDGLGEHRDGKITRTEFLKYYEDASYAVESDVLFKALMNHAMTFSKETFKAPFTKARRDLVNRFFDKFDTTGDGVITVDDLEGVYDATKHPKYITGEWTEDQVLHKFINAFEGEVKDGKITREDFLNYYAAVSATIISDATFNSMMSRAMMLN